MGCSKALLCFVCRLEHVIGHVIGAGFPDAVKRVLRCYVHGLEHVTGHWCMGSLGSLYQDMQAR